jgi:hypothetical protein
MVERRGNVMIVRFAWMVLGKLPEIEANYGSRWDRKGKNNPRMYGIGI